MSHKIVSVDGSVIALDHSSASIPTPKEVLDPKKMRRKMEQLCEAAATFLRDTFSGGESRECTWIVTSHVEPVFADELTRRIRESGWEVRWYHNHGGTYFSVKPASPSPEPERPAQPWYCFWR